MSLIIKPEQEFKNSERVYLIRENHKNYGKQFTILDFKFSGQDLVYKYQVRKVGGNANDIDYFFPNWLSKEKPINKSWW